MEISSEEIFGEEGSPLNRTNFAVGVYQNVVYIYGGECSFTGNATVGKNTKILLKNQSFFGKIKLEFWSNQEFCGCPKKQKY